MHRQTDDVRIRGIKELLPPIAHLYELPINEPAAELIYHTRRDIGRLLRAEDDRLLVVIGPCSIHDPAAAEEYARRLLPLREKYAGELLVVMRVYFEKPRTTVGWKGLINDPHLNETFDINTGLRLGRRLLLNLNSMGMPAATEFLDMITPQYLADLISWGATVGFKNGTDGNLKIAVDAIRSASVSHHFLSVTKTGHSAIVETGGNPDCHVILRGGKEPNYEARFVQAAAAELAAVGLAQKLMVDFSHANSRKDYRRQMEVCEDVAQQMAAGDTHIFGVMVESHLVEGRQDLKPGCELTYGQSITDAR